MAIVRMGGGESAPAKRPGGGLAKKAAKKGALAKHAAKKHAGKGAAKKATSKGVKHAQEPKLPDAELARAYHHLQRAAALVSLLEPDSGSDLRRLLEHGADLYRRAAKDRGDQGRARAAAGLLRAAEHLGMAGLYEARHEFRIVVEPPSAKQIDHDFADIDRRLEELSARTHGQGERLVGVSRELLRRVAAGKDVHLRFELVMAADGLCAALEEGI